MEDFVRKTKGVKDITSLPLNTNHELDIVSDIQGKIYIKILNTYKEMLFDNGTEPEVLERLDNLEMDNQLISDAIQSLQTQINTFEPLKLTVEQLNTSLGLTNNTVANLTTQVNGQDQRMKDIENNLALLGDITQLRLQLDQTTQHTNTNTENIATQTSRLTDTIGSLEVLRSALDAEVETSTTVNNLQNTRLTNLETKVVNSDWTKLTPMSPFTEVSTMQVKKQNGIVFFRGTISNGKGDCFTIPEGFRPPAGSEYHYILPGRSTVQTDQAKIYVRPNGLCSIVSVTGTTPYFLEPISYSLS